MYRMLCWGDFFCACICVSMFFFMCVCVYSHQRMDVRVRLCVRVCVCVLIPHTSGLLWNYVLVNRHNKYQLESNISQTILFCVVDKPYCYCPCY